MLKILKFNKKKSLSNLEIILNNRKSTQKKKNISCEKYYI